ncbi:MAG TPA: DUF3093 domain-containing protein [Kineosporiaceae bacterium]
MPTSTPPPSRVERLWPSAGVWLALLLLAGFCAAVAAPFGSAPALVTLGVAAAAGAGLMLSATPVVGVRGGEFVARRAHVPVHLVGEVTVLDAAAMRQAAGPDLDARAYLCLRGWIRTGLRLDLVDPQDPTPYWLVSSRHPQRLLEAVQEHRGAG